MPVPLSEIGLGSQRRLLRDEVFERLIAAINDGTFKPGERLNDGELEQWLGVSRTPIRQALARLVELGVVEMSPNRYSRVAEANPRRIPEAMEIVVSMWQLAAELSLEGFGKANAAEFARRVKNAQKVCDTAQAGGDAAEVVTAFHHVADYFAEVADNEVLSRTLAEAEVALSYQARLTAGSFDYDRVRGLLADLKESVSGRDVAGTHAVLEGFLTGLVGELLERIEKTGRA